MQKCILYILKIVMNFIYFCIKLFPMQKNKVIMLSRQANCSSLDFELLKKELEKQNSNIKVKTLCKKIPKKLLARIGYCFFLIKCMYHIATSKICIVDGYFIPICVLHHKKGLVIVQIWHAMGAIKKFGMQITDKKEGSRSSTAKIMQMHKNYTNVICTSNATKKFYAQAFNIAENKILTLGMPRIDYLLGKDNQINQKVEELKKQYPEITQKKIILYVPTFRKGKIIPIEKMVKAFEKNSSYQLIVRLHPLDNTKVEASYLIDDKYTTMELLKVADYVITDYSAVAFEAAVLNKKIFFYLYDIEEYKQNRGLNINLKEEMPDATYHTIEEIAQKIENNTYNLKELETFQKKYIETIDTQNTKRIADYLLQHIENNPTCSN